MVRIEDFHSSDRGSNPRRVTKTLVRPLISPKTLLVSSTFLSTNGRAKSVGCKQGGVVGGLCWARTTKPRSTAFLYGESSLVRGVKTIGRTACEMILDNSQVAGSIPASPSKYCCVIFY